MALYEHVFLARQDISIQQVEALIEQFKGILVENGGSVGKIENWGLRTTTYRIKKNRKAHYVMMNVDAPHAAISEMERQMRINDDVLRHLTIRVGTHDDGPSIMMNNNRDERRPRGGVAGESTGHRRTRESSPQREAQESLAKENKAGE